MTSERDNASANTRPRLAEDESNGIASSSKILKGRLIDDDSIEIESAKFLLCTMMNASPQETASEKDIVRRKLSARVMLSENDSMAAPRSDSPRFAAPTT